MTMSLLVALLIGIAAYLLFIFIVPKAVPDEKQANIKSALNRLHEENRVNEHANEESLHQQLKEESPFIRTLFGLGFMKALHAKALQAGYQNNLQQVLVILLMAAAVFAAIMLYVGQPIIAAVVSLPFGYAYIYRRCNKLILKRNRKFIDKFPDALDMIVRSVRSGFPLATALQMLADNAEEPVREEFRKVSDDLALGRNLHQALSRLALRINETDIRFFVVVLSVQQETGGNLSEIIGNLSSVIRKRKQLRHRIRAMTSEGIATGYVLGGLPVFVFVALYFLQPNYLTPFWTDPMGEHFAMAIVGLMAACFVVIKNMINVDI